jgi:hypothetical protein
MDGRIMNFRLVPHQKNFFNTRYYDDSYYNLRIEERLKFKEKLLSRLDKTFNISQNGLNYLDAVNNICFKEQNLVTLEKNKIFNGSKALILLRGTYETGRNLICKQMARLDPNAMYISTTDFNTDTTYILSVFPMFKTIVTGFYREDVFYSSTDIQLRELKVKDYLDIITFVEMHELFKEYNLILDGNRFQNYSNKFMIHSKQLDSTRDYFDLYLVNDYLYDYLNTPLSKCWYDKHGWNKPTTPDNQYCAMNDNLFKSERLNIPTYALKMENTEEMLIKFLLGDLLPIKHFKNKPLVK